MKKRTNNTVDMRSYVTVEGQVPHWERSSLYQIVFAIDMARAGVTLGNKMLWRVTTENRGDNKIWKAERKCGAILYSTTLLELRRIMIKYESHIKD